MALLIISGEGQRAESGVEHEPRHIAQVGWRDLADHVGGVTRVEHLIIIQETFCQRHGSAFAMVGAEDKLAAVLLANACERSVGHLLRCGAVELPHDYVAAFAYGLRVRAEIEKEQSGVAHQRDIPFHRIYKTAFVAELEIEPRVHAGASEIIVEQEKGVAARIGSSEKTRPDNRVRLTGVLIAHDVERGDLRSRDAVARNVGEIKSAEIAFYAAEVLFGILAVDAIYHHVAGSVIPLDERPGVLRGEGAHAFRRAEYVVAKPASPVDQFLELVVDGIGRTVLITVYLLNDHLPLLVELGGREHGIHYEVGKELEGAVGMSGRRIGVDERLLFSGVGVEFAANGFHAVGDVPAAAVLCPLEDGVLHEMGETLVGVVFIAASGIDGNADVRHIVGMIADHNAQSVGESGDMIMVLCVQDFQIFCKIIIFVL